MVVYISSSVLKIKLRIFWILWYVPKSLFESSVSAHRPDGAGTSTSGWISATTSTMRAMDWHPRLGHCFWPIKFSRPRSTCSRRFERGHVRSRCYAQWHRAEAAHGQALAQPESGCGVHANIDYKDVTKAASELCRHLDWYLGMTWLEGQTQRNYLVNVQKPLHATRLPAWQQFRFCGYAG